MGHEPPGPFITSLLELKLDTETMFEWQRHRQESTDVPHFTRLLLEFLNLRAQASETCASSHKSSHKAGNRHPNPPKPVASFAANTSDSSSNCVLCTTTKHPLYACPKFKSLSHDEMVSTLKDNKLCLNCLKSGHFVRECKSLHRCRQCQKPHHTLLHVEPKELPPAQLPAPSSVTPVQSHLATGLTSNTLLMTCWVLIHSPNGSVMKVRALLDSASSASFISERLTYLLELPRTRRNMQISGVAHGTPSHSTAQFSISPLDQPADKSRMSAIVVQRVTCDLPVNPVTPQSSWTHISDIDLADPDFGRPGRIDLLLGVDIFVGSLLHGRRVGIPGSPSVFETKFGWVLAGSVDSQGHPHQVATHHSTIIVGDDLLRKFWEIEEGPGGYTEPSPEEQAAIVHFKGNHRRNKDGRFIVPLPRKSNPPALGESHSQAVRRFLTLERSLYSKNEFSTVDDVMQEYFDLCHAEPVPAADLNKSEREVFYLPMHAVKKESSTTTKIRAMFDASAKSSSGVSLNDLLLVGPTVHSPLIDVLLRFRLHRVALTTDVSKMYRAIELIQEDRNLHRFVWRQTTDQPIQDFRMTRITFGVSASSFIANMCIKQNALDFSLQYPQAVSAVENSFYVDDGLTGADSIEEAILLRKQLQELFAQGGFLLRKWNSSEAAVLEQIPSELRGSQSLHKIPDPDEYTKALGIQWNSSSDYFRLTVTNLPDAENLTKRRLVSDIARTFDVLRWFSPAIIEVKILLQRVWELKIGWDELLPDEIKEPWLQWRTELVLLSDRHIPRCYYPKQVCIHSVQLHGFSDASEEAYAGVVYLRMVDTLSHVHISLVTSKTKVAPIKRLTIPRLELCGAHLLARILRHVQQVFRIPVNDIYAWTDSMVVLSWLTGNPRRFKPYVGNRVSHIIESIPPDRWNHVSGTENPADCASRGLYPSELLEHRLWWDGPDWLKRPASDWPFQAAIPTTESLDEIRLICHHSVLERATLVIPLNCHSSYIRLKRVTAWMFRFIQNCRNQESQRITSYLTTEELLWADHYWILYSQQDHFSPEIESLRLNSTIPESSSLFPLHPFIDSNGVVRVGGRIQNAKISYDLKHPIILHGKQPVTRLIISTEHLRLLHGGPTLVTASLSRRYHIVGCRKAVRSIVRNCIVCRRATAKPHNQLMGQLPTERVTPGAVFENVGVDYAGPFQIKYGPVRKPTIIKAYVCLFVSLSVKAVHLETVSDLTTEAFVASLRRFIARRGKPSCIWSDHGTNFVGAAREMKELLEFVKHQKNQETISDFCSSQGISWKFIPEHAPHFGGLWESAVKSMKTHLRRIISNTKLTFEEFTTVLTQIEAVLNSRPLAPIPCDDDGIEPLTPGHFLVGKPLEALPDPSASYCRVSLLRRWHLCQSLIRHFWKRWSTEYLHSLRRYNKWHRTSKNLKIGDVVVLQEDNLLPLKWPLGKIVEVHPGKDGLVRVVQVKTSSGVYRRPISKIALLLSDAD